MRLFGWELRKIFQTPMIIVFLAVCLAFNVILIFTNTYDRDYIQFISGTVSRYGDTADEKFVLAVENQPDSEERDRLLSASSSVQKDFLKDIETQKFAEAYVKSAGISGFWADVLIAKYQTLDSVVARLAEEGADQTLYAAEVTNNLHRQLFDILLHAVLTEGIIAAFLSMLLIFGMESFYNTAEIVYSAKTGRKIVFSKIGAGFLCGLGSYVALTAVTLFVYFLVFDFSGIWNSNVSSQFHTVSDQVISKPFLTWESMTVLEYLWMQIALGAFLLLIFSLLGAVLGLLFQNSYLSFAILAALWMLFLLLPDWLQKIGWFGSSFAAALSPFWVWNIQSGWFTDLGAGSPLPWWESVGVAVSIAFSVILLLAAKRKFYRKDLMG